MQKKEDTLRPLLKKNLFIKTDEAPSMKSRQKMPQMSSIFLVSLHSHLPQEGLYKVCECCCTEICLKKRPDTDAWHCTEGVNAHKHGVSVRSELSSLLCRRPANRWTLTLPLWTATDSWNQDGSRLPHICTLKMPRAFIKKTHTKMTPLSVCWRKRQHGALFRLQAVKLWPEH